ncbi:hypothetical protein Ahy_B04g069300 [Arachis hypogaea]|uniref:Protein FAR1-RELATED SEQUENCE n=1 Tax=Arachis hypogaea TaxID=3818 RepID=A0A444ZC79_ARAHY|nr:hypothetical protein Ahy_B04g069300 [Arachis hypogaea]
MHQCHSKTVTSCRPTQIQQTPTSAKATAQQHLPIVCVVLAVPQQPRRTTTPSQPTCVSLLTSTTQDKEITKSESMHVFYGGFLHSRTSLVQFVHEYKNVLGIKKQRELEDDAVDSMGVISSATSSPMERQFQQEYTTSMFRDVETEFVKKANCKVSVVTEEGVLCYHCLVVSPSYKVYKVPTCYVLPYWSKNIKRKHTYVKSSHDMSRSDESHTAFRGLCAHFFNIAQEFVNDDDETALLYAALEETRAKLTEHRAKKRSKGVTATHDSIGS